MSSVDEFAKLVKCWREFSETSTKHKTFDDKYVDKTRYVYHCLFSREVTSDKMHFDKKKYLRASEATSQASVSLHRSL